MTKYYCYRESWGYCTNLQLFSLSQAWRLWSELKLQSQTLNKSRTREYCVVIIDLLGLSVTQLLGQNIPENHNCRGSRLPCPKDLLPIVFESLSGPIDDWERLKGDFCEFVDIYDDCRHFGEMKYNTIECITLESTERYFDLILSIWKSICSPIDPSFESIEELLDKVNSRELDYGSNDLVNPIGDSRTEE